MRIFLDANVLFSASASDGAVRAFLRQVVDGGHACCVDAFVVAEARRNLERKRAAGVPVLDALLAHLDLVPPASSAALAADDVAWLPEKDRPVLAAAIAAGCDVLMTGDRTHFGAAFGRRVSGVAILPPAGVLAMLG